MFVSPKSVVAGPIMVVFSSTSWFPHQYQPWQHPLVVQPPEFNPLHPFHDVARASIASIHGFDWHTAPLMPLADIRFAVLIEAQRDFRGVLLPILDQRLQSL